MRIVNHIRTTQQQGESLIGSKGQQDKLKYLVDKVERLNL
ncbi:hypothetical protein [Lundtoftevirus Lu221]|uniref:Uncharacterized protein n=1 Tax=phage PKM.Lu.22.1 TaxID=3049197 RepID=A0AAF0KZ19_9CAUD|nr:hypothetical protein [phage PKM.Lu.22.1]